MPLTRRSLLRSLGALAPAWYLRDLPAAAQCTTNPPSPNSAFVLLEGPWLIFPKDQNNLMALSVGGSMDTACVKHFCILQTWNCGIIHPRADGALGPGDSLTVTANSTPGVFSTVFGNAFCNFPFIWAATDSTGKIKGQERFLTLQVPNVIHIAGLLKNTNLSGSGYKAPCQQGQTVFPHVTTILQYDPPAAGGNVSVTVNGAITKTLGAADQLVVTMFHSAPTGDSDLPHMQDSFAFLRNHLTGDGAGIQVTYKDATYNQGDSDGFSTDELGLEPQGERLIKFLRRIDPRLPKVVCPNGNSYSNCCGGGLVSGGG